MPQLSFPAAPKSSGERRIPTLRDMPERDRPAYRAQFVGPGALATTELLALLIGGQEQLGIATELMQVANSLKTFARMNAFELQQIVGIGESVALRLQAAVELGRRLMIETPDARPQITSPADAANLVQLEMSLLEQEEVRVLVLDTRNRVLDIPTVYVGSLNTSVVRVGELFREAIRLQAAAVIIVHNHPSGDPTPSPEDVRLTEMLVEAGKLLDVELIDHLIIGQGRFVSLKERGLGFR